jgi:tetratricopeptide (TPR) repeat protein
MKETNFTLPAKLVLLAVFIFASSQAVFVAAQTPVNVEQLRKQAAELTEQQRFTEAMPLWEKVIIADPDDSDAHFYFAFTLLGKAANTPDAAERQKLRVRARTAFIKAKELGNDSPLVEGLIGSIPPDGSDAGKYSANKQAEEFMRRGEAAFSSGKMDEAFAAYQNALKLDPKIYEAALYSGDVFTHQGKFDQSEIWYRKAIEIDPNRETAYRYSATPFMKQKKFDQARDRYVEAFITEPYSRFAQQGLIQWGQATGTRLAHPRIDVPEFKVGADGKANSTITLGSMEDDGSMAWIGYTAKRSEWLEKKFARTFPNEKQYRHSLQEEAEALREVVKTASSLKSKKLNPQIELLKKLDSEGLLEAYILLARPDEGIARDFAAYRDKNRERLRQYVIKFVIGEEK